MDLGLAWSCVEPLCRRNYLCRRLKCVDILDHRTTGAFDRTLD